MLEKNLQPLKNVHLTLVAIAAAMAGVVTCLSDVLPKHT